jgi:hypothetical protein
MIEKTCYYCIALCMMIILLSCELTGGRHYEKNESEDIVIEYVNDLFVPGENPDEIYFETNDNRYWSERGYTLWYLLEREDAAFDRREASLSKLSGSNTAGYGFVYCYGEDPYYGRTMLLVMINTVREYTIAEVIETEFDEIIPWTESPSLNAGYNQNNTIELTYDSENELYTLGLNGVEETTFRDDEAPFHTGGRHGYIVVISPLDEFPEVPVSCRFVEME